MFGSTFRFYPRDTIAALTLDSSVKDTNSCNNLEVKQSLRKHQ